MAPAWPPTPDARRLYRRWRLIGDRSAQGNLAAYELGLGPVAGGWTERELTHLVFLRWLACSGRLARLGD